MDRNAVEGDIVANIDPKGLHATQVVREWERMAGRLRLCPPPSTSADHTSCRSLVAGHLARRGGTNWQELDLRRRSTRSSGDSDPRGDPRPSATACDWARPNQP